MSEQQWFRSELAAFVYLRTYSAWRPELGRRERWEETVTRVTDYFREVSKGVLTEEEIGEIHDNILHMRVMPSMRLLAMAGDAARASNVAAFNCAYTPVNSIQSFSDIFFVLLNGCGAGYSVERQYTEQLPAVAHPVEATPSTHVIADSAEGWCVALRVGLDAWYAGRDVVFDYSLVRPAGTPLKTKGGRASGPEPLRQLLDFARSLVRNAAGRKLRPIEVSDLCNMVAQGVVVGGVRRSSEISLSDLDDDEMRDAKVGAFWETHPYRSMSNNSAVYLAKPDYETFSREFDALIASGTGERGLFSRAAANSQRPQRRKQWDFGCNPCAEIILRGKQFCNLSSVVARAEDTEETLARKIRVAAIIGTLQSTLTDFKYLDGEWKANCDEERLLGISVTGELDSPAFYQHPETMERLRDLANAVNREYAARFGINPAAATSCVKPEGTCSLVTDSSSGLHPRFSRWFLRRVRVSASDPLCKLMRDYAVPHHPEVGQTWEDANTFVFEFPCAAPEGAITRDMMTALDQLEYWKTVKLHYVEHNPSATIYVKPDEWSVVKAWVYDNFDCIGGLSFLPSSDHVYELAPYSDLTEEEYNKLKSEFPKVNWDDLSYYELEDRTTSASEVACTGGACELA